MKNRLSICLSIPRPAGIAILLAALLPGVFAAAMLQGRGADAPNGEERYAILEIPPGKAVQDRGMSERVFRLFAPSILLQDFSAILPSVLLRENVKYVIFSTDKAIPLFDPFLKERGYAGPIAEVDGRKVAEASLLPFLELGEGEWHDMEERDQDRTRWMGASATINMFIPPRAADLPIALSFSAESAEAPAAVDVLVNGTHAGAFSFFPSRMSSAYVLLSDLRAGENRIELVPQAGCRRLPGSSDSRCLSIRVKNIRMLFRSIVPDGGILSFAGFYDQEEDGARWMGEDAELRVLSLRPRTVFVGFEAAGYGQERALRVRTEDREVWSGIVSPAAGEALGFSLRVPAGTAAIALNADGCSRPSRIEGTGDRRCLGIRISEVRLETLD